MKKYTFHVKGTHCASCKILIEDILMDSTSSPQEEQIVKSVRVDLKKEIVEIETDSEKNAEELAQVITSKIKPNGYTISVDKKLEEKKDNTLWQAILIGFLFLVLFYLLQKSGILNLSLGSKTTPTTSFIIGIIASLSSCLAIVGGLVLSLSAKVAKDDDGRNKKPFILFHAGRLLGFALLGGILGVIGKVIGVNFIFSTILGLLASVVMILLGVNLLGVFKKKTFTLPSNIFSFFRKVEHATLAPIVIGLGTFFLPCGFTQAMQIAALSSGSFMSGFLIMFLFALGTLPVLALLSFSSVSFAHSKYAPLFFKSAGVVVVVLALFNFINSLAVIGFNPSPVFDSVKIENNISNVSIVDGKQIIDLAVKGGYSPQKSVAKAGIPTILRFTTSGTFDCSSSVRISSMNVSKTLELSGTTDIDLGNPKEGILRGSCSMGMYPFEINFQN